ncbi:MAG: sugar phosphate isomerase/epimerase [Acidobacteria bacterium]|nr:MAG: sugar phosphate isomerase/epimerase [Acidobacteriota bacterium]
MTMISRRDFVRTAFAGMPLSVALSGKIDSIVNGVRLGTITYSFRQLPRTPGASDAIDVMINALTECGIGEIELFSPDLEPVRLPREELRKWRLSTPMDHYKAVRKRFDDAGISLFAYTVNFRDDYTDEELERAFEAAKALGVNIIAASTQLSVAKRLAPFAEKHKINVAMHGHSNVKDPNEFATPESFAKAIAMSKYFKINLDIGHFTAANFDAVQFIRDNHDHITHLHVKDRQKNDGANLPWGEGDTPIKQVLTLLREKKYPIRAFVEYEYRGTGTPIEEVKKCMTYMRQALTHER